jgi:hypothetical protein
MATAGISRCHVAKRSLNIGIQGQSSMHSQQHNLKGSGAQVCILYALVPLSQQPNLLANKISGQFP